MSRLLQDALFAIRSFRKSPVFSLVAVLSLALGIGANTAIFTLLDQVLLRGINALAYPMYQDLRDRNQVFTGMMCRYRLGLTISGISQTEAVSAELVSGNYFPLLGLRPAAGRLFTAEDDQRSGEHPYAVISYAWWQTRFASDPKAIGKSIRVNNYQLAIVGVAQPGFDGLDPGVPMQMFVPMTMAPEVLRIYQYVRPAPALGEYLRAPEAWRDPS